MRNGSYWEHWGGDSSETQAYAPPSRQTDTGQGGIQGGRPGRKGKEGVRHRPRKSERTVPTPRQTPEELGRGEAGAAGGRPGAAAADGGGTRFPGGAARRLAGSIREALLPPHVVSQ